MTWSISRQRLELRHPFTISRGTSRHRDTLRLELEHRGIIGFGEAAPHPRYGETLESAERALQTLRTSPPKGDPESFRSFLATGRPMLGSEAAALAAFDMAVLDWVGKLHKQPLFELLGIDATTMPDTSFTVGIDAPEVMASRASELETTFRVIKVKLGTERDRELFTAVRAVVRVPLRVDANEGWSSAERALEEIEWLADQNVEFVEQPLPASLDLQMPWLRERSPLPILADESVRNITQLSGAAQGFHGINIKLMKCGGVLAAVDLLEAARERGLRTMLGCMVESSCGISAAAQVAPLADYADLDSNLYLSNDPFCGHPIRNGRLVLQERPGLGILPRAEADIERQHPLNSRHSF